MLTVSKYTTIRNEYHINKSKADAKALLSRYKYKCDDLKILESIIEKGYYVDLKNKQVLMVNDRGTKRRSTFFAI